MNVKLKFLLGAILAVSALQVFADTPPGTTCPNNKNYSCTFNNLQPWNNGAGQATYFYCKPNPTTTTFLMRNRFVLITGFSDDGELSGDVNKLNTYAFGAYLDPNRPFKPEVIAYDQNGTYIPCFAGNPDNRPIWPGPPGTRISRQ